METLDEQAQSEDSLNVDKLSEERMTIIDVGARLKQAREAKKITTSEVATQLKLTKSVIDNLEMNAWDKLNGRTYARGYLTSYANFLGLPVTRLLMQFDESHQEELQPLKKVHRNHIKRRGFPWLRFIFLGLLSLAVWFAIQQWPEIKEKFITQMNDSTNGEKVALVENNVVVEDRMETPELSRTAMEKNNVSSIEEQASEQIGNAQVTTLILPEVETAENPSAENTEPSAAETEPAAEEAIENVNTTLPTDPMQDTLAFTFGGACWISVKDAAGKTLLNQTKQAGEHAVLTGQSPFQIILGDASNVKMRFNGASFNTQPFINASGTARFTVNNEQL